MSSVSTTLPAMTLRPEAEVLLACARTRLDPATATRVQALLEAEIDWTELLQLARSQRVMQLLCHNLHAAYPQAVPEAVRDRLQRAFLSAAHHNLLLTGELVRLLELLERHGIPAIPFKGPLLAERIYGNLALRPFSDLDILVHRQDLRRARDLLVADAYQSSDAPGAGAGAPRPRRRNDCQLRRRDGKVTVELQCGIFRWPIHYPPDFAHLWERFEFVELAGTTVRNFLPEDLLLNLCVHGAKHRWDRLVWIVDVAELVRRYPDMDWNRLTGQARARGARRMLWLGLLLAQTLLDAELPASIIRQIHTDDVTRSLATQVCRRLFCAADSPPTVEADAPLFYLRMRERWWDRMRLYLRFYPSLLHPLHVVRKYRTSLLKPLLGR